MTITLPAEAERIIEEKVRSGKYVSPSEVILEGLRLLQEEEELRLRDTEEIREKIDHAWDQLERGEGTPGDQVIRRLRERSEARRLKQG